MNFTTNKDRLINPIELVSVYEERTNENVPIIKGLDRYIDLDVFKVMYKLLKDGYHIILPEDVTFDSLALDTFLENTSNYHSNLPGLLYTENQEFLNKSNIMISKTNTEIKVLIIDMYNFYHRLFHALPPMSHEGQSTTLLKALSNLIKWIDSKDYTHLFFASEGKNNFRKVATANLEESKRYKAGRSETDPDLKEQIQLCDKFLENLGFPVLSKDGYEADDLILSIADEAHKKGAAAIHVFTGDKDMVQGFADYPTYDMYDPSSKQLRGREYCKEKFGIDADFILTYQALVGDTADNLSGIKGVGGKSAIELIDQFGHLNAILDNAGNIEKTGLRNKIENGREEAEFSLDMVTMRRHLLRDLNFDNHFTRKIPFTVIYKKEFAKFGINY